MKPKTVGRDSGNTATQAPEDSSGLLASGIILTLDGEMQIRDVKPGDRVITRDTGMAVVRAVHKRQIRTDAVCIQAGSLGHTRPDQDVTLPAGQPVLVRDWRAQALFGAKQAMVPALRLVDGEFVTLEPDVTLTVYEIEFDHPHVIYVDGLEVAAQAASVATAKAA